MIHCLVERLVFRTSYLLKETDECYKTHCMRDEPNMDAPDDVISSPTIPSIGHSWSSLASSASPRLSSGGGEGSHIALSLRLTRVLVGDGPYF